MSGKDAQLDPTMVRFLKGDTGLFRKLYGLALWAIARTGVPDHAREDLASDAMFVLCSRTQSSATGATIRHVQAFVIGTARHLAWRWLNRRKVAMDAAPLVEMAELSRLARPTSVDLVNTCRIRELLTRAINSMPNRMRRITILRYFEDLRNRDIADLLGVSPGTVGATLHSARARLRNALGGWLGCA